MASTSENQPTQAVRFSDVNEEIKPDKALQHVSDLTDCGEHSKEPLSPEAEEEIRNLSMTLQKSRCQARRMEKFSFEPVSLPTSRVSTRLMVYQLATDLFVGSVSNSSVAHTFGTLILPRRNRSTSFSSCLRDALSSADPSRHHLT